MLLNDRPFSFLEEKPKPKFEMKIMTQRIHKAPCQALQGLAYNIHSGLPLKNESAVGVPHTKSNVKSGIKH